MFRRFLLLLLMALLPLQGIAASFVLKCEAMAGGSIMSSEVGVAGIDMPCHEHDGAGGLANTQPDQGCCHHFAVAIPFGLSMQLATHAHGQIYPAIAASFTDHLPDHLQRPPLSPVI